MKSDKVQMEFNYRELELIYAAFDEKCKRLRSTGDFPEEKEYLKLSARIISAKFLAFDKI